MAVQYSVAQRNAAISTLSTTVGAAGICKIFTGAQPANCLAPDSGANLVQWTFTATFAGAASSGTVTVMFVPLMLAVTAGDAKLKAVMSFAELKTTFLVSQFTPSKPSGQVHIPLLHIPPF